MPAENIRPSEFIKNYQEHFPDEKEEDVRDVLKRMALSVAHRDGREKPSVSDYRELLQQMSYGLSGSPRFTKDVIDYTKIIVEYDKLLGEDKAVKLSKYMERRLSDRSVIEGLKDGLDKIIKEADELPPTEAIFYEQDRFSELMSECAEKLMSEEYVGELIGEDEVLYEEMKVIFARMFSRITRMSLSAIYEEKFSDLERGPNT